MVYDDLWPNISHHLGEVDLIFHKAGLLGRNCPLLPCLFRVSPVNLCSVAVSKVAFFPDGVRFSGYKLPKVSTSWLSGKKMYTPVI